MATPSRTGTAVTVNISASTGSTSVTVPTDADMVVAMWSHWDDNGDSTLSTLSYDGTSFLPAEAELGDGEVNFNGSGGGAAVLVNPSTGSNTLSWGWSSGGARSEGGALALIFYKDANTSDPTGSSDVDQNSVGNGVTASLTSVSSDSMVICFAEAYNNNTAIQIDGSAADTTIIDNVTINTHRFDVAESTGVSGAVDCDMTGESYSVIVGLELKAGASTVSGTLSANDPGPDTAALTGGVELSGSLAATESALDTASITGQIQVSGTLAVTEAGADTGAFTTEILVAGTLSVTEVGADTAAFTGTSSVTVSGTLAAQEVGADSSALTGQILIAGTLSATEPGPDTAALTGNTLLSGSLDATETGPDLAAFTGNVIPTSGAYMLAQETGSDTADISGAILISGTLGTVEIGTDTGTLTGTVLISGSLAAQETGADTAAFTGSLPVTVSGTLDATEAGIDTGVILGQIKISGTFAAQEVGADTAAFYETLFGTAVLDATETGADVALFGAFVDKDFVQPLSIEVEIEMTETIYNLIGQKIIYKADASIAHIRMIIDNEDQLFPAGFESQAADGDIRARVQVQDVASPSRGDLVADEDGKTYYLASYMRLNEAEWSLDLRRDDG